MGIARDEFDLLLREWVSKNPSFNRPETVRLFDTSHLDAFLEGFEERLRYEPYFDRDRAQSVFSAYTLSWEGMWRGIEFDSPQYRYIRLFHLRYFVRVMLTHGLHVPEIESLRLDTEDIPQYLRYQIHSLWAPFSKLVRRHVRIHMDAIVCYDLVQGSLYDRQMRKKHLW